MPFLENQQIAKVFHNYDNHRFALQQEFGIDVKGDIFDTAMNAYFFDGETEKGTVAEVAEAWRCWEGGKCDADLKAHAREDGLTTPPSDWHPVAR